MEAAPRLLTCAQCVIGKEENKKQTLLHKAANQANRLLQKEFKKVTVELNECRDLLKEKTKETVVLKTKLESKESSSTTKNSDKVDVIEEAVETAGDFKTCEFCHIKVKGIQRLIKHQQSAHLTCRMCPAETSWIGLSIPYLQIHQKNTHKVRTSNIISCAPCKLKFPDGMALNVHKLKHHDFQCKQCGIKFVEKKFLEAHMNNTHVEKLQEFKCIVCEYKVEN